MREFWNTVTRNWSDSINLLIGAWLFVSVWVLSFASIPAAMWNALILGALVAILAIAALMEWREWEEWTDMLVGAWLVISPWVLGFKSFVSDTAAYAATLNTIIVGVAIFAFAAWSLWSHRDERARAN